jgi:hypothetical protein
MADATDCRRAAAGRLHPPAATGRRGHPAGRGMWAAMDRDFGLSGWRWRSRAQSTDLPEWLIGADHDRARRITAPVPLLWGPALCSPVATSRPSSARPRSSNHSGGAVQQPRQGDAGDSG